MDNMDNHIIIKILLEYHQMFCQWKTARILNKSFKTIVDNLKYDKECVGRQSLFYINLCSICEKKYHDINWLHYPAEKNGRHRMITHCHRWRCRLSVLYSMIEDYKSDNIYLLRDPWTDIEECKIPRSNGSITLGKCKTNYVVWIEKRQAYYVYTWWVEDSEDYEKLVPLKHFTPDSPKIIFQ